GAARTPTTGPHHGFRVRKRRPFGHSGQTQDFHRSQEHHHTFGARSRRVSRHPRYGATLMKNNLDTLTTEIPEHLKPQGLGIFRGIVNELHEQRLVFWDVDNNPDYRQFVECAVAAGVKLMIFNFRHFEKAMAEDALERLEECDLPREEQRSLNRRIK